MQDPEFLAIEGEELDPHIRDPKEPVDPEPKLYHREINGWLILTLSTWSWL